MDLPLPPVVATRLPATDRLLDTPVPLVADGEEFLHGDLECHWWLGDAPSPDAPTTSHQTTFRVALTAPRICDCAIALFARISDHDTCFGDLMNWLSLLGDFLDPLDAPFPQTPVPLAELIEELTDSRSELGDALATNRYACDHPVWAESLCRELAIRHKAARLALEELNRQGVVARLAHTALVAQAAVSDGLLPKDVASEFVPLASPGHEAARIRSTLFNLWAQERVMSHDREATAELIEDACRSLVPDVPPSLDMLPARPHRELCADESLPDWLRDVWWYEIRARLDKEVRAWDESLARIEDHSGELYPGAIVVLCHRDLFDRNVLGPVVASLGEISSVDGGPFVLVSVPTALWVAFVRTDDDRITNTLWHEPRDPRDTDATLSLALRFWADADLEEFSTFDRALVAARAVCAPTPVPARA